VVPRAARRIAEWPITLVLLGVVCGLLVVASNHFRAGTVVIALSVVLAMVLRGGLSERRAGLLVVRSRWVDVFTMGLLGVSLTVLALVVPPPDQVRSLSHPDAGIASDPGSVLMARDPLGSWEA
jgi:hypothetical protein